MDRNILSVQGFGCVLVVPHTGDVDRNTYTVRQPLGCAMSSPTRGTWIEIEKQPDRNFIPRSSPTRGTWIEIETPARVRGCPNVVPHTGDVDRNTYTVRQPLGCAMSSPTRGTWIEIEKQPDRNFIPRSSPTRGTWIEMKCRNFQYEIGKSSPTRGTWIEMQSLFERSLPRDCRPPHGGRG